MRPSLRECARRLRTRVANCSVRIAFALYAAAALVVAIALSFVSTGLLGLAAEATLPADPYAYSGTYVYDAAGNRLVPAEALSWYETAAYDAAIENDVPGEETVVLYVASETGGGRRPIPLDNPPAGARTNEVRDIAYLLDDTEGPTIALADLPAYNADATAARSGTEAATMLAAELPANAAGEKPVISTVGYYLPYPGDPQPYRALAWAAIASVPLVFVACLVVAGRRFYRTRIAGPIEAINEAARRISANDLDFSVEPVRDDELGRLCVQIEAMRAELERTESELWRAAENRRRVNAAFAHDLRTPLTVIRGQAELIEHVAKTNDVRAAASAIMRQAERLSDFADSMRGLDALDAAEVKPIPLDPGAWLDDAVANAHTVAREANVALVVERTGLPVRVSADGRALDRIADNLVSNAVRYAHSEVHLSLSWTDGTLELTVADDGPGFDKTALTRAAEPFWGESKGTHGHMGLGLYVARTLAERHGGQLELSTRPSGGALVRIRVSAPECPKPL